MRLISAILACTAMLTIHLQAAEGKQETFALFSDEAGAPTLIGRLYVESYEEPRRIAVPDGQENSILGVINRKIDFLLNGDRQGAAALYAEDRRDQLIRSDFNFVDSHDPETRTLLANSPRYIERKVWVGGLVLVYYFIGDPEGEALGMSDYLAFKDGVWQIYRGPLHGSLIFSMINVQGFGGSDLSEDDLSEITWVEFEYDVNHNHVKIIEGNNKAAHIGIRPSASKNLAIDGYDGNDPLLISLRKMVDSYRGGSEAMTINGFWNFEQFPNVDLSQPFDPFMIHGVKAVQSEPMRLLAAIPTAHGTLLTIEKNADARFLIVATRDAKSEGYQFGYGPLEDFDFGPMADMLYRDQSLRYLINHLSKSKSP